MQAKQAELNRDGWSGTLGDLRMGVGINTGMVIAGTIGGGGRLEYTVVGDAVNLCQRLQQFAEVGQTVLSEATWSAFDAPPAAAEHLDPQMVKGRDTPVAPWRLTSQAWAAGQHPTIDATPSSVEETIR
jgi:class 3 adenylate cyclase